MCYSISKFLELPFPMATCYWCICLYQHNAASWLPGTAAERNSFKINNNLRSKNVNFSQSGCFYLDFQACNKDDNGRSYQNKKKRQTCLISVLPFLCFMLCFISVNHSVSWVLQVLLKTQVSASPKLKTIKNILSKNSQIPAHQK